MAFDYSTIPLGDMLQRAYDQMNDLQRPGVALAKQAKGYGVIFDVWMGVGKTFMGLTSGLIHKPQTWLIIGSKNSAAAWFSQRDEWFPELSDQPFCMIRGEKHFRESQYRRTKQPDGPLFYFTSFGSFVRDIDWLISQKIKFDVITIDEPQKAGLRNPKSGFWAAIKAISAKSYHPKKLLNITTGTLTSKGSEQLWAYLHLCAPNVFTSKWKFLHQYNYVFNGPFGKVIGGPRNTLGLAAVTRPYIYRVDEKAAGSQLPPLHRMRLPCELTPEQQEIYNTLSEELWALLPNDELITVNSMMTATIKLRQFINCPATIESSLGVGNALETVLDKIQEQQDYKYYKHNIIATPFIPAIDIFRDHISKVLKISKEDILIFKGGLEREDVTRLENIYRKNLETIALVSVKYSQSFNLETCRDIYFTQFEWDQDENKQTEGRGRRTTSDRSRTINSYYCSFKGSITDVMFDNLNMKEFKNNQTYKGIELFKQQLKNTRSA